ncbi:MAG: HlyD family efflux transporter periplasmic adaptor subunit [Planctomycetales bacterium]|nr:HlyD family efflux transporter periplasmic adaptor subunit [Planctomycetales bacterium]
MSTITLATTQPNRSDHLSGTVEAWKSEKLGFEVAGRVQFVVEPEEDVWPVLESAEGEVLRPGTVLARLDPARYLLQVESIQAKIDAMQQNRTAVQLEIERVIPAEMDGAEAERTFAEGEYKRNKDLFERSVIPKTDFDRSLATFQSADAKVRQIMAREQAKRAEMASLAAQIKELEQALNDARRDVADCELVAPFRGQVADVQTIPGGYVERGTPVLTLQMMDPIKVQVQVSSETTRRLRYRDRVEIHVAKPDGGVIRREGLVYLVAPVADPATRTFPVTLLVQNEKLVTQPPDGVDPANLARTRDVWEVYTADDPALSEPAPVLETRAIHRDAQGHYVWKVNNWEQVARKETGLLNVTKVRVERGTIEFPFLGGLWRFTPIRFLNPDDFDLTADRVAGALLPEEQADSWQGEQILFERDMWMLRPGDVVNVDLRLSDYDEGYYVPLDAIRFEGGQPYLFTLSSSGDSSSVRRVPARVEPGPDGLRRVEPTEQLPAGTAIVRGGVHFLSDGETVKVVGRD